MASLLPFSHSDIEARAFYSYALQRLPGVVRSGKPPPVSTELLKNNTEDPWRPFDKYEWDTTSTNIFTDSYFALMWLFAFCTQVQGVYGRPGVNSALLPARWAGCSVCFPRAGTDFSQGLHLCLGQGTLSRTFRHSKYKKQQICIF